MIKYVWDATKIVSIKSNVTQIAGMVMFVPQRSTFADSRLQCKELGYGGHLVSGG